MADMRHFLHAPTTARLSKRSCTRKWRTAFFCGFISNAAYMMMDLQFINVSDPQQIKSSQARHLVRSQAMRSYRHRQKEHLTNSTVSKRPHHKLFAASKNYASPSTSPRDLSEEEAEEDVLGLQTHLSAIIKATKGSKMGIIPHPLSRAFVHRVLNYCM
jgi:hypothetical protein